MMFNALSSIDFVIILFVFRFVLPNPHTIESVRLAVPVRLAGTDWISLIL